MRRYVLNQNGTSQEDHHLPEVDQGFPFFVEGVSKFVDSHKKNQCRMSQAHPSSANHPCACVRYMHVCFIAWVHAQALNVSSILFQATEFVKKKIEHSSRLISAGKIIINVQFHSSSANFGIFSDRFKRLLVVYFLHCYEIRVPKMACFMHTLIMGHAQIFETLNFFIISQLCIRLICHFPLA